MSGASPHKDPKKIVIIGNGVSGITAARHIRKMSDARIQVISDETDHFFSRTALMYVFMGHMRYEDIKPYEDFFWDKNRIERIRGYVRHIDTEQKLLTLADEKRIEYDTLILGLGSSYNTIGWPGQNLDGVQGLYSWQDLERLEDNTKNAQRGVIVGGGLIGVELAEMLHSRNIDVSMLVREDRYWGNILPPEEGEMVSRHMMDEHGVDLQLETELESIEDDGEGRVAAAHTKDGQRIPCDVVGLTIGVHPKIELLKGSSIETDKGVLVDHHFRTNVPDVYAVGDCAQFREPPAGRPPIEQVWYTGKIHGEVAAHNICGYDIPYEPGVWFNSAKFFDIEYQVYGTIPARPDADDGIGSFYWEHPSGKKGFRITWDEETGAVKGFDLMGIRFRHEVCEEWIKAEKHLDEVMRSLEDANFDPEFYRKNERAILQSYNQRMGKDLKPIERPGFLSRLFGVSKKASV